MGTPRMALDHLTRPTPKQPDAGLSGPRAQPPHRAVDQARCLRSSSTTCSDALASSPRSSRFRSRSSSAALRAVSRVDWARAIAASIPSVVDVLGPLDQGRDHLVLGHDRHVRALDEQVASLVARRDPDDRRRGPHPVRSRHSPSPPPGAEVLCRRTHPGRPGRPGKRRSRPGRTRAGDQVDVLALPQTRTTPAGRDPFGLIDRVGRQRVADRVADPLGQQRGDARRGLHDAGRRRTGLGHPEVQRMSVTSDSWR